MNFTLTITGNDSSELLSVLSKLANKAEVAETVATPAQLENLTPVADLKAIPKTSRKKVDAEEFSNIPKLR